MSCSRKQQMESETMDMKPGIFTYRSGFHQKFTVLDQRTVWYGSVNFLSFGAAEESIMRLESPEIAGQLTDTVSGG